SGINSTAQHVVAVAMGRCGSAVSHAAAGGASVLPPLMALPISALGAPDRGRYVTLPAPRVHAVRSVGMCSQSLHAPCGMAMMITSACGDVRDHTAPACAVCPPNSSLHAHLGSTPDDWQEPIRETVTSAAPEPSRRQSIEDVLYDDFCQGQATPAACHLTAS